MKDFDPADVLSTEEAQAAEAQKARERQQQEIEDFKWLMGTVPGRRIVWRLLEKAGVFRSSFRPDNSMAFLEGQRNIGLLLICSIHEHCPEKYHVMVKEQQEP